MKNQSRRNFVKTSAATGLTFTFVGLIRAHGQTGIPVGGVDSFTRYNQWGIAVGLSILNQEVIQPLRLLGGQIQNLVLAPTQLTP